MPQQLSLSRLVLLLKILAIKFVLFYFYSFGLACPTVVLFSLSLAISQFRPLKLVMKFRFEIRTIIARGFWNLIPLINYLLRGILTDYLFFYRKTALTGLPIEVIRGSETPVVCVMTVSEISQ